jgi:hypothetical protein
VSGDARWLLGLILFCAVAWIGVALIAVAIVRAL